MSRLVNLTQAKSLNSIAPGGCCTCNHIYKASVVSSELVVHHERGSVVSDELAGDGVAKAPTVGGTRQQRCQRETKRQEQ